MLRGSGGISFGYLSMTVPAYYNNNRHNKTSSSSMLCKTQCGPQSADFNSDSQSACPENNRGYSRINPDSANKTLYSATVTVAIGAQTVENGITHFILEIKPSTAVWKT